MIKFFQAKGKLGRVIKVHQDGDMKVLFETVVTLSPACCDPVSDPNLTKKAPAMPYSDDSDSGGSGEEEEETETRGGAVGGGDMVDDGRRYAVNRKTTKQATSSDDENEEQAELKKDITGWKIV